MILSTDSATLVHAARKTVLRGLLFTGLISVFLNLAAFAGPLFMINVYERVLPTRSYDTLYGLMAIGALAVVFIGLLEFIRALCYIIVARGIAEKLDIPSLSAAVTRSLSGHVAEGGRAIQDVREIKQFLTGNAVSVPFDAACSVFFLIALYFIHPHYALLAGALIAVMLLLNVLTDLLTRSALKEANDADRRYVDDVSASLRHAETIEAMGILPSLVRRWRHLHFNALELWEIGSFRAKALLSLAKAVQKGTQMATVATGAFMVLNHEVTAGVLFAAMVLTSQTISPFSSMIESWRQWSSALQSWTRVRSLLEEAITQRQTMPTPVLGRELVISNLVYVPPGCDLPVLRSISLSCSAGEILGIVGPSGAGKSVLARLLVGILEPTAGGVYLDGQSTHLWERSSFGIGSGYLSQSISLLNGTVRTAIARMEDGDPSDVIRAAQAADIHELIGRLPHGYDTPIKEGMNVMSGGQLQRLALARALYGEPNFIVLDEPNSNLDSAGEIALLNSIQAAKKRGAIVVLIAHRPSLMAVADRIAVIDKGVVRDFGSREDVLRRIAPDMPALKEQIRPTMRVVKRPRESA